ncbi:hypothetical protein WDU94_005676, partial [Cyamophila willieti]
SLQETLQPIQEDVARHSREIKSLNHDKRRKNLVIFGLPQEAEESFEQLEEKIMHLFIHTMGVTTFTLMELDFVKRTKSEKMPKPVVLGFTTQRRKISILKNRGKLRGSRIYIHEDSTPEIRAQEKALRTQMYELRREGKYAIIRAGKLITDDRRPTQTGKNNNKRALSESPNVDQVNKRTNLNMSASSVVSMDDLLSNEIREFVGSQSGQNITQLTQKQTGDTSSQSLLSPLIIRPSVLNPSLGTSGPSNTNRTLTQASIDNYLQPNENGPKNSIGNVPT